MTPVPPDLREYVESELHRVTGAHPEWHVEFQPVGYRVPADSPGRRNDQLVWRLAKQSEDGDYVLEADPDGQQFLIWFGHHQAGADPFVTWIMRPAVHISFEALWPPHGFPRHFRLGDVLEWMIQGDRGDRGRRPIAYPPNYLSLT